jgi:hypothetical protein
MGIRERSSAMKRNAIIKILLIALTIIGFMLLRVRVIDSTYLTFNTLQHRKGTIIVEKCIGVVTDFNKNGELYNGIPEYNYISYKNVRKANVNDVIVTYFVYNPFNNVEDDILFRLDFIL